MAVEANSQNRLRQQVQERLHEEALAQIAAHPESLDHPARCVTTDREVAKGSGRSVQDVHLYDLLAAVQRGTGVFSRFGWPIWPNSSYQLDKSHLENRKLG